MKSSDIEIYIKEIDLKTLSELLNQILGQCSDWQRVGTCYKSQTFNMHIPITWYPKAIGSWHCLHFDSNQTPWSDDLACAQAMSKALNIEVRCSVDSWDESHDKQDELWYKVLPQDTTKIQWKTQ